MINSKFYFDLENGLAHSSSAERINWATQIINHNIDLRKLCTVLKSEEKTATRFAWLLSEIGELSPVTLFHELPFLLKISKEINHFNFKESFANYWRISGIPEENEAEANELLFVWLQSASISVTIKSRAILVLYELTKKYPKLKNELRVGIEMQKGKYTKDFAKRSQKVLEKL